MSLLLSDEEFIQLKSTKELYQQIFNCSVLPIIIHDMHLNIVDVNDKALAEFGYSREELVNLRVLDLHTDCEWENALKVLEEMQEAESRIVQTKFKRKDGSIFSATASPCKIQMTRNSLIHLHLQNIENTVEAVKKTSDSLD